MTFPPEQSVIPISHGAVSIEFYIPDPNRPQEVQLGRLGIQIHYSDNSTKERVFDLLARLQDDTQGEVHLANLASLKTYILARIESELLP